ncbi:MAG: phosphoglycerate dehydrogenase, partial [Endozoicomonas sp.]
MPEISLDKSKIHFLLLEGIHPSAVDLLRASGYTNIDYVTTSLPIEELKKRITDARFVGIRS